jgi:tRNA threonylcarbamoyladenosine biosynthesis protein TsaE
MKIKKITNNYQETKIFAKKIAKNILKNNHQKEKATIIALEGDLGAGKTTFVQGFAEELKIKEKILSPTFLIIKRFNIKNEIFRNFFHIDCYRIKKTDEIISLDFKKIISNPKNIVLIEWANKIKKILPKGILKIKFDILNQNKRKISVEKERDA